ncbi:tRNA lysidine(34) synthetase TilS [Pleionea sp. CnH1-48]|uniref:tRNA lysidine(34) synthetase TilS n=1 Tax=Pleionea sp. CnH1-48 TaxID=2954494 RepID=UPI002096C33F|nr:tRNA lysidine(34) synthetase TilS [Pleionea sp. CnH1-48]MCO7224827.1 tRNA lysidine(34) synthetase TilS [Pleionea sp. CnH1-48]
MSNLQTTLLPIVQQALPDSRWVVGLSGGVDSSVLLYLLADLCPESVTLEAIHVHHGLSDEADQWAAHCESLCRSLDVELTITKVSVDASGDGLEAAARAARWQVFDQHLCVGDWLWLGHHQDDQAETLLLNLLRGTGVKGAAAMKPETTRNEFQVMRPLLSTPRSELETLAQDKGIVWVDDPSNEDTHLRRNWLRHQVMPQFEKHWPGYRKSLGRFCEHMNETEELLQELALDDWKRVSHHSLSLDIVRLNQLSRSRQKNLLRYWASSKSHYLPTDMQLSEFLRQLASCSSEQSAELTWGDWLFKQSAQALYLLHQSAVTATDYEYLWSELKHPLWIAELNQTLRCVAGAEVAVRKPHAHESVHIVSRRMGVKCHPHYRAHSQSLKKVFQEAGIPPWVRNALPLVYYNDQLVAVVGLFYESSMLVTEKEEGIAFSFIANQNEALL